MVWLNVNSKQAVDELYRHCERPGAKILTEPEDEPWPLREFDVADPDNNQLRAFYYFFGNRGRG